MGDPNAGQGLSRVKRERRERYGSPAAELEAAVLERRRRRSVAAAMARVAAAGGAR